MMRRRVGRLAFNSTSCMQSSLSVVRAVLLQHLPLFVSEDAIPIIKPNINIHLSRFRTLSTGMDVPVACMCFDGLVSTDKRDVSHLLSLPLGISTFHGCVHWPVIAAVVWYLPRQVSPGG